MAFSYKGAITFGLVYIPITLTAAIKENNIGFNMLEKETLSRVKYKKTCIDCNGREIAQHDIVKGYQYEKGQYVIFSDEDFEKIKTVKDKNITIQKFVNLDEVDPVYFDRAFYVNPAGGERAYALLLSAMEKENRAGVAKTVLCTRETLVLLHVHDGVMMANTLFFHDEVRTLLKPTLDKITIDKSEFDLAVSLINNMTKPFEPELFKDEYNERLRTAIEQKIAGKEIEGPREEVVNNVINIMEALKKSIEISKRAVGK